MNIATYDLSIVTDFNAVSYVRRNGRVHGCRTYGRRAQNGTKKYFLATRHLLLSQFFYSFCSISVSILCRICLHIPISDTVQTVYELPLLTHNTAVKHLYTNRERCELLTGYLSLGALDWR